MVGMVDDQGVPMMCCGMDMEEVVAGAVDAAKEKHVPLIAIDGNKVTVTVGSVEHPMASDHNIAWVALETTQGNQRKELKDTPSVEFMICDGDAVVCAYAYCNLHGLWKGV